MKADNRLHQQKVFRYLSLGFKQAQSMFCRYSRVNGAGEFNSSDLFCNTSELLAVDVGHDVDVVARAWTLAYGVMSGQEFPDNLPSAYAEKYGPGNLHDHENPRISSELREQARRHAEAGVAALRRAMEI